jgi:hypothetical protein
MVKRLSARTFSSNFWMISSVTTDGLHHEHHFFPLQILLRLPVHNIYKNKLAMNSAAVSPFVLRNRITARTSHLAGF